MRILPRPSWMFAATVLVAFAAVLVVDGFVRSGYGDPAPPVQGSTSENVPFAVTHGAAIIDHRSSPVRTFAAQQGAIALTFDGGPDPVRTPVLLAVLQQFGVRATFFVSGSAAARNPDLVRQIRASGSEIGIRSFAEVDLAGASPERVQREITLTQLTLAGAIGETTYLFRPPYAGAATGMDDRQYALVRRLADQGFMTALSDIQAKDWIRKNTQDIVNEVVRPGGAGAVIALRTDEGAPTQLASALARALPALQEAGYRFTTLSDAAGLPAANDAVAERDVNLGRGMLVVVAIATGTVSVLELGLLITGAIILLRLMLMLVFAIGHAIRRRPKRWRWGPTVTAPVSVIVPAYNEKECIAATIRSLKASDHPIEIIVVDDGSTDETAAIVRELAEPGVRLVRQANGGKPAALNNGIRHAKHELIVMIDGDTVFEPTTIRKLVQPFARPEVGAVSGNAKVANRKSLVGRWQHIEYVIGFNIDRRIADVLGSMTTIPGAVGAFRKRALTGVGGVSDDTLAEDTDLTMAISAAGWRVVYEERARAWTEAPTTLQQLWRQRYRWSYGTIQAMWKHRRCIVRGGPAGRMGRIGLGNLALFQVLLPATAPLIDVFLVYGLIALDPIATLTLWGAVLGIQMLAGLIAFAMERENPLPLLWMPLQQIVYRQMMYAVLLKSLWTAIAGVRLRWQKLKRVGDFGGVAGVSAGPGR